MLPVAAYANRLSLQEPVQAKIVRVINADANPNGPGIVTEDVAPIDAILEPTRQSVPHGSYGIVSSVPETGDTFSVIVKAGRWQCDANSVNA